ncbi:MAG: DUF402 domain-containing protein [Pyrinomonadaceae bacterium]
MSERQITVNARKYDGSIRRSWMAGIVSQTDKLIVAEGRFETDVLHNDLGLVRKGTVSFEYFWTNRWYNIFRFHEPDGALRNYYCNVAMPAVLKGDTLVFVDLDIDVVVWPDSRVDILDRDDFTENSIKFGYPAEVIKRAEESLTALLELIGNGELP